MGENDGLTLSRRERAELRSVASYRGLVWGGIYERGGADADVMRWLSTGLIRAVKERHTAGNVTFSGGYLITDIGRRAVGCPAERP